MPRKLCLSVCLSKKLRVVYRLMFFSICSMYFEASSNFGQVRFRGVAFGRVA
jgi:hypothetical protein